MNDLVLNDMTGFESLSTHLDEIYISQLFDIYHQRLLSNIPVCQKLERRGISRETIEKHQIGFCDRTLNRYVPVLEHPDGAGFRGVLRRYGLTKINGHEVFRGCVVEPIYDNEAIVAACGIKLICPSRPAPRIIQWYRSQIYPFAINFALMRWGQRYVTN